MTEGERMTDIQISREGRRILVVVPIERNYFRFYLLDREARQIAERLLALLAEPVSS